MASDAVSVNKTLRSYQETVLNTVQNDTLLNANIYDIHQYIENIKKRYVDEDEITLSMGIFGYLGDVNSNALQNAVTMAAEYSNEAIPIKAKFEKNVISHALMLGINKIFAEPATMQAMFVFYEDELVLNTISDTFRFDRDIKIMVGDYEFHLPYDLIIKRIELPTGEYIYTGMYDTTQSNPIITRNSNDVDPYLKPTVRSKIDGRNVVMLLVDLRQYEYMTYHKTIITNNPLESKMLQFEFDNQLAGFDVDVKEYDQPTRKLKPVYNGLNTDGVSNFCNYTYIDSSTIRVMFDNTSYLPTANTEVTVNLYTCQGANGNISYKDSIYFRVKSDKMNYDRLNLLVIPTSDSQYGIDKKSIADLKRLIPKEALARGSVTNSTDINNYFNTIDDDDNKLFFFKKMDNPLARLYYAFVLMDSPTNIIPTNTIPIEAIRRDFDNISDSNYILTAGNVIKYDGTTNASIAYQASEDELNAARKNEFLYMNPFMCIVNKKPLYVSYYMNIMDVNKLLEFTYVNQDSKVQFIATKMNWYRHYLTDRDTYFGDISIMQNIQSDIGLVHKDDPYDPEKITGVDVKVLAVFYTDEKYQVPYRWAEAEFVNYDQNTYVMDYKFKLNTDNKIDKNIKLKINNVYEAGNATRLSPGYMANNMHMKIFVFAKDVFGYNAGLHKSDHIFTADFLEGYSLTNEYTVKYGIDFLYNYSDLIESHIKVKKQDNGQISYIIDRVPVISYDYVNTEERIQDFINNLEKKRIHILDCLDVLEDSFGIDIKFFNTYGPSKLFYVNDGVPLNRVNLSMTFKVKFLTTTDKYLSEYIKNDIRKYIEDKSRISDIHIPNIITYITQKYAENVTYFEFLDFNGYGPGYQHIYRKDESIVGRIPEFLNINTIGTENNALDINIIIA
jgi:hypothetical protein